MDTSSSSLPGFDASIAVQSIDWKVVTTDLSMKFAFVECVSGVNRGPHFGAVWNDPERNIPCGAYQRLCSATSGEMHAELFLENLSASRATLKTSDLPPIIDLENDAETNCRAPAHFYVQALGQWLAVMKKATNRKPIIYTNYDFARFLCLDDEYADYPLWISHYSAPAPLIPKPWTCYSFWQHTQGVAIKGSGHAVDLDSFSGDANQLRELVKQSDLS